MAALFKPPFEIKPHRVVLEDPPHSMSDLTDWCTSVMGPECQDWGRWHMNSFDGPGGRTRTDIFRFKDARDAVLFKLRWGGS